MTLALYCASAMTRFIGAHWTYWVIRTDWRPRDALHPHLFRLQREIRCWVMQWQVVRDCCWSKAAATRKVLMERLCCEDVVENLEMILFGYILRSTAPQLRQDGRIL